MLSVIDAMKASNGFVRPIREGEQVLRSGLVISVGKKGKEEDVVHVQGLVLRTSGLGTKHPAVVEIWVDLSKEYGDRVLRDNEEEFAKHCDCPAGNSQKCKHVLAVMLYLASVEEDDLDDLSCTDLEKQWGTLKKTTLLEFEAKPLSELCHVKGKRDVFVSTIPTVTKEMEENWIRKLTNSAVLSEYSLFMSSLRLGQGVACCEADERSLNAEKRILLRKLLSFRSWCVLGKIRKLTLEKVNQLDPEIRDFYETNVVTTLDMSENIICAEQGSPGWISARKLRITASKARAQYTYFINKKADWGSRYKEVYHSTFSGNADTNRGLADEPLCREKYEDKFACNVLESGLLVRPELPWLSCSLDGTVLDSKQHFVRNLEVKSFKEGTRLTAEELIEMNAVSTLDQNGNVKAKTQHYAQMQLGMMLSGMSECDYCMWSGVSQDFVYRRVSFDAEHCYDLCSRLINVYFDEFLPRIAAEYVSVSDKSDDDEQD